MLITGLEQRRFSVKIILSRKGFDSSNGGSPSPIMPDGSLLSMPIPSGNSARYTDLHYHGLSYSDLLHQLNPKFVYDHCHVDPDIRKDVWAGRIPNWKPAFGQVNSAQGVLMNAGVEPGDIFLFFGWFRRAEKYQDCYRFIKRNAGTFYDHSDLHVIYGYMQIGRIITNPGEIIRYSWHPHSDREHLNNRTNALYIPSEKLSLNPNLKGYGTLNYRQDRVLTMENQNRGTWNAYPFLMPENVYGERKNSAKKAGLFYSGIWQELVVYESNGLLEWVKSIVC